MKIFLIISFSLIILFILIFILCACKLASIVDEEKEKEFRK